MSDLTPEEFADGLALWGEHKPQTGDDWIMVAERCIADPEFEVGKSSPLFAGLVGAVEANQRLRDALEVAGEDLRALYIEGFDSTRREVYVAGRERIRAALSTGEENRSDAA